MYKITFLLTPPRIGETIQEEVNTCRIKKKKRFDVLQHVTYITFFELLVATDNAKHLKNFENVSI